MQGRGEGVGTEPKPNKTNRSGEAEQRRRLAEQEVVLEKELRPALEELQAEGKRMEEMDGVVGGTFRSEVEERLEGMARAVEELGTKMDSVRRAAEVREEGSRSSEAN